MARFALDPPTLTALTRGCRVGAVFFGSQFNGDVSLWNTSNVTTMHSSTRLHPPSTLCTRYARPDARQPLVAVFYNSQFNGEISGWDTSSVTNMQEGTRLRPPKHALRWIRTP